MLLENSFLGVAIDAMSALAGGKTGSRVGKNKGRRLYSKEGLIAIVFDKSAFPFYENYIIEIQKIFKDLLDMGIRIPGTYEKKQKTVKVSNKDWEFIEKI